MFFLSFTRKPYPNMYNGVRYEELFSFYTKKSLIKRIAKE